ncbi:response regulator [Aquabacterium sp. A08]|nr:response regulator [Aquabacterium sp. A08]NIC41984.1 response regulator [Aquabacterium sp. A08]
MAQNSAHPPSIFRKNAGSQHAQAPLTDLHLLHLEDNPADHELVARALARAEVPCALTLVDTLEAFQAAVRQGPVDAVLADYHLAGFSGLDAWDWLRAEGIELPFVIVSGAIGEATVADAMVRGVSDYVDKHRLARLPGALQRALDLAAARRAQADAARALTESRQRLVELTEHLQASIDRERADIAREIHDDIGGSLAAVKLDLAWLARRSTDAEAQTHVQAALAMAEHALGASQRIMRNLRPAVLDQGLMPALQWLTRTFAERTGLAVGLHGRLRAPLDPKVDMVAYRTVQEALTNVLKHAQARAVRVEVSDLEDFLTLEISDDGRGAGPAELAKLQSFGLLGLKERAQTVGGWLDVATAPGQGMTLILSVPLGGATTPEPETAE